MDRSIRHINIFSTGVPILTLCTYGMSINVRSKHIDSYTILFTNNKQDLLPTFILSYVVPVHLHQTQSKMDNGGEDSLIFIAIVKCSLLGA